MKHREMITLIDSILDRVKTMHTEGQKEYAMNKDNVFSNFYICYLSITKPVY